MVNIVRLVVDILRIVVTIARPFIDFLFFYIERFLMGETKTLPTIDNEILLMPATKIAEKIRKRQLKCVDIVRSFVDRACAVQPIINAVVGERYEDAIREASEIDSFLESSKKTPEEIKKDTPLLGVPFSCKESIGIKGLAQTCGVYKFKDRKADKDSDAAALYRAAGAIPVAVTNVPEVCMWWNSSNMIFGITKNPYDHSRTVGGSTGGEGAFLTAAGAAIGIGNDIGGSIRMPASFNGIYGHKPSMGIRKSLTFLTEMRKQKVEPDTENDSQSKELGTKIEDFVSTGPMCRYAEDLPLSLKILSADDKRLQLEKKVNFQNVKVYYIEELPGFLHSARPDIKQAIRKAASHFEDKYGIKPLPLKIDELKNGLHYWECKILQSNVPPFKLAFADESGKVYMWWHLLKSFFRISNYTLPCIFYGLVEKRDKDTFYHECLKQFDSMKKKFLDIFQDDAIILIPTHPEPPPYYHLLLAKFMNTSYTAVFSVLGFPVTAIPVGMSDGLPIGIQAVSGPFKDHLTIAAAIELEKVFGGWKSPCPIQLR